MIEKWVQESLDMDGFEISPLRLRGRLVGEAFFTEDSEQHSADIVNLVTRRGNETNYLDMHYRQLETLNLREEELAVIELEKAIDACGAAALRVGNFEGSKGREPDLNKLSDAMKAIRDSYRDLKLARKLFEEEVAQLGGALEPEAILEDKTEGFGIN